MKYFSLITVLFLMCSSSFSSDMPEVSYGEATNEQGEIVYREKHTSEFSQGKLQNLKTEYFLENGEAFGSISSNFIKSTFVPDYQFEDKRYSRFDGVKWIENQVIAYAKEDEITDRKEKKFTVATNTVAGQGLHNFIREHIGDFVENKDHEIKINFLIPMNQDMYSFRVRAKEVNLKKGIVKIRIEADSWLFRLIAPHIDVMYEIKSRRLLEYKGPSNLLSFDKKKMNVIIAYKYKNS